MWRLSLRSFSWHWIPFGQLFYVLTKVIGCTWERKNFIHSVKYIQLSENLQRNLIFSISPKSQHRVYLLNIQKHSRHFVQIDFYSWTNHRIPAYHCVGPALPNNPSPKGRREPWERGCPSPLFTALASRKERDDLSTLKHVLSEPHTASSQSHIFLLPSWYTSAKLMHKRQAAKPLCRPAKIWNYFFDFNVVVCSRAGCASNLTAKHSPFQVTQEFGF